MIIAFQILKTSPERANYFAGRRSRRSGVINRASRAEIDLIATMSARMHQLGNPDIYGTGAHPSQATGDG